MTPSSLAISSAARAIVAQTAATMLVLIGSPPLHAGELRLLSAASIQQVFKEILDDFEQTSGHRIVLHYATMGAITERIRSGEAADLVISSRQSIATLLNEQRIEAGSQTSISKVGAGVAVPPAPPARAVARVEDFRRALPAATTIVYADPDRGGAAAIRIGIDDGCCRGQCPAEILDPRHSPRGRSGRHGDPGADLANGRLAAGLDSLLVEQRCDRLPRRDHEIGGLAAPDPLGDGAHRGVVKDDPVTRGLLEIVENFLEHLLNRGR